MKVEKTSEKHTQHFFKHFKQRRKDVKQRMEHTHTHTHMYMHACIPLTVNQEPTTPLDSSAAISCSAQLACQYFAVYNKHTYPLLCIFVCEIFPTDKNTYVYRERVLAALLTLASCDKGALMMSNCPAGALSSLGMLSYIPYVYIYICIYLYTYV